MLANSSENSFWTVILSESPFSNLHAGGPDVLLSGKENVIEGIFEKLKEVNSNVSVESS